MKKSNIVLGCLLIILGVIFGLNALGLTDINVFFEGWWTLFLIVPALIGLTKDEDKAGDFILLFIGVFLFLAVRDIVSFDLLWKLLVPVILVIIGISLVFNDKNNLDASDKNTMVKIANDTNDVEFDSVFGSKNMHYDKSFKKASVDCVFGSFDLDLSDVDFSNDAYIEINSLFAGVNVILPDNVNLKLEANSVFGSSKDEHKISSGKHNVYVKSNALFGGIIIK